MCSREELDRTSHRPYSPGFYFGRQQAKQETRNGGDPRHWEFIGVVEGWQDGVAQCSQRGKFCLGDTIEALTPLGERVTLTPEWIKNELGE